MNLVPAVVWVGTTVNQRYKDVKKIGALATEAAAAAILIGKHSLAIEWLEQGRSVVWNQLLQLRTPHDQLFIDHPTIAEELKRISAELHASDSLSSSLSWDFTPSHSLEAGVQRHHRLAENYDQLLNKIRKLPGYADFIRPKSFSTLKSAASDGPVIVVNIHGPHSDALVISPERADIMHVPLLDWTSAAADTACHQINSVLKSRGMGRGRDGFQRHFMVPDSEPESGNDLETALYTLWVDVVHPILDSLGYLNPEKRSPLPHITWCTAGVMSFLPLHAAGNYSEGGPKTTDFVVSSYTPTLNALLPENTPVSLSPLRVLAVGQAATPGHAPLPATEREISSIKDIIQAPNQITEIEDHNATKQAVLAAMESHDWVHLACHAHQSIGDPEESGFFLQDGTLSLATINKKQFKNKGLAFLSACQTATGDESLPDEAVHLAAGMLTAGYPSVIATMWSVMDSDAPVVAEKVYSELLKGEGMGRGAIARALDKAVAELRNQIGEDQFWRWVPYIHFGV
ncbi:hypothetical protein RSOLAG22IIIB_07377 [Rhizoctonia solani]|uniref:CHAT domain-containing protein n=1 Tax=Rhizoctonia solani TaxID=456999 RepID=A0A0K6FMI5_9AGAM|nr:hypothetical protein RSOLAG22IIIB_07377 [Rhizoctonia solani]